jgi:16S rRNA (uracil1498-N3)-methyltransferase
VPAHVVVEDLEPGSSEVVLGAEDAHHLHSVLRLRVGEPVGATDGRGRFRACRYAGRGRLEADGPVASAPPRTSLVTVGFVPVKGDRPEWTVQKLTELGVDRIVVLSAARSVVRWEGSRAGAHLERLRRVARAAVMQSRQWWLPELSGVVDVGSLLAAAAGGGPGVAAGDASADGPADASVGDPGRAGVALAERGGGTPGPSLRTVLVGPEGGWDPAELAGAADTVALGSAVLRAETAAVAAGVLLTALRAGLVRPGSD